MNGRPVRFGPFSIAIDASRLEGGVEIVARHVGALWSPRSPHFTLSMTEDPTRLDPSQREPFACAPERLLRPTYDPAARLFSIAVHPRFFAGPIAGVWHSLMCRVFATMCAATGTAAGITHGAAVRRQGRAILLLGGSGIGKTTAARSAGGSILHDDQVIIGFRGQALTVDTPPIAARERTDVAEPEVLAMVCAVGRGGAPALRRLETARAVAAVFRGMIAPYPIGDDITAPVRPEKARLCLQVCAAVPPHELITDLEGLCWALVDRGLAMAPP